jgi:U3 small nucleolar RNA-associated protein 14
MIQRTEDLHLAHISVEDVAARRAELRWMREVVFWGDVKAKIKSKRYRRLKRQALAKLDMVDGERGEGEVEGMRWEVQRARERATLRYGNAGG